MVEPQPLSEVLEIKHGYAFGSEYFQSDPSEYLLLTPGNFHKDQNLYFGSNTKYYDGPVPPGFVLANGDLLLVMTDLTKEMAILGNAVILESDYKVLHNQRIGKVTLKNVERHDKRYFCYLLNSPIVRKHVKATASGTTVRHTSPAKILSIRASAPTLSVQTRIADVLDVWEEAISRLRELIENSKAQKKALMQQLLTGKKRLPGFSDEWRRCPLGQLFSERKESGHPDFPLLSITQNRGVIYRDDVGRKDTSNKDKSKYKRLCPDDIGYNTMRMWQGVSALSDKEGIVSPAYTIMIARQNVHAQYMAFLFKLPETVHDFYRYSQGLVSDTWNLKFPNFSEVKVTIPARPEQEAIASILQNGDRETKKLTQHLENLQRQKIALMQQLLTGKRRVKVAA